MKHEGKHHIVVVVCRHWSVSSSSGEASDPLENECREETQRRKERSKWSISSFLNRWHQQSTLTQSGAAAGHAIEYFATLGRKKLVCKSFQGSSSSIGGCGSSSSSSSSPQQHQKNPAFIWNEAITDIAIIHAGETIPEEMRDWEMVQASVDNNPTGLTSIIAFQRRSASQRLDHITKVGKNKR